MDFVWLLTSNCFYDRSCTVSNWCGLATNGKKTISGKRKWTFVFFAQWVRMESVEPITINNWNVCARRSVNQTKHQNASKKKWSWNLRWARIWSVKWCWQCFSQAKRWNRKISRGSELFCITNWLNSRASCVWGGKNPSSWCRSLLFHFDIQIILDLCCWSL